MTEPRNVEDRISLWLEEDAVRHFPDHLLKATYEQTRKSKQQVGWRGVIASLRLSQFGPALASAAVVLVLVAAGIGLMANRPGLFGPASSASPMPSPTASPTPTPTPPPTPDPWAAFIGTFVSDPGDADKGIQTMTVERSGSDSVDVLVTDTIASVCQRTPSTMTGSGHVEEGARLVIPTPDYQCDDGTTPHLTNGDPTPLNEVLRNLKYNLDAESGNLLVGTTEVWVRQESPDPSPTPQSSGSAAPTPVASPSPVAPTPVPSNEAERIVAEGGLQNFAETASGALLTVWDTCDNEFDTDCGIAWRLGSGSEVLATGVLSNADFHPDVLVSGDGFILTPDRDSDTGTRIDLDGTATPISMACTDASWPDEAGRLAWSVGHSYIDTVTGDMCPINQLGGRSVARGLLTPDNSLFALVDNELGPETLTVGRYDGQQWEYHDLATPGGAWTSVMAADGSTVVILVANLEPEPGPDSLNGFVYTTDGGETWTEVSDPAVLRQNLPFSTALSDNLEDWFSGYTSMALADPSTVYVADGNGELWRSDDFSTFSPIEVSGFVSDLRPTADGVIARVDDNSLIHISADGTVDARTSR